MIATITPNNPRALAKISTIKIFTNSVEFAESANEVDILLLAERLVAEHEHLMLNHRFLKLFQRVAGQWTAEVDA